MKDLKNAEILVGVKAIYRNGEVIYRAPASLPDELPARSTSYDQINHARIESNEELK
jgi:hypothetical protein